MVLDVSTQTSWYFLIHNEKVYRLEIVAHIDCLEVTFLSDTVSATKKYPIRYGFYPLPPPIKKRRYIPDVRSHIEKMQGMILKKVLTLTDIWISIISVIMSLLNPYIVLEVKYIAASGHIPEDAWVIWYISKYRWLTFVSQIVSVTCSCITCWCPVFYYSFKLFCLAINTYMYNYYMYTSISNVRSNLVGLSKSGVRSIVLSWKELQKTICKM